MSTNLLSHGSSTIVFTQFIVYEHFCTPANQTLLLLLTDVVMPEVMQVKKPARLRRDVYRTAVYK